MAYCTMSTDCYNSDVFVYTTINQQICIIVAKIRFQPTLPRPTPPVFFGVDQSPTLLASLYHEYHKQVDEWVKLSTKELIGLPLDGEIITLSTREETLDKLLEIRQLGYKVPQSAIQLLKDEIQENDSN